MIITVAGLKITLDDSKTLGAGGEATVFASGSEAYKIFHTPTPEKQQKVEALIKKAKLLPPRVLGPTAVVYDASGTRFVGYRMPLAPKGAEPLLKLANKNFRKSHRISPVQVIEAFLDAHQTLSTLHKNGFVIGDHNDLNELFVGGKVYYVDVDSFQFDQYVCNVATEPYLCPTLYGKDLRKGGFTTETDWYSYAVLLFRSLLLVHPYGGNNGKYKQLMDRARYGVTVFDESVKYPKIGLPRELLSAKVQEEMEEIFRDRHYDVFPRNILEDYRVDLVVCDKCHEYFPESRGKCPFCDCIAKPRVTEIFGHYTATQIVATDGEFVFTKLVGQKLYAIAIENGNYTLYLWNQGNLTTHQLLAVTPGMRFEIAFGHLIITMKGNDKVVIYDFTNAGVITTTTTDNFLGLPVTAGTTTALYRIANGLLMKSELSGGNLLDRVLMTVPNGQTWIAAGEESANDKLIVGSQIMGIWDWRIITKNQAHDANISSLEKGEKVISFTAKFDTRGALVMRECKKGGKTYVRLDYIDNEGKLLTNSREKLDIANLEGFAGAALGNGHLIVPTASGLKGRVLLTGANQYFTDSSDFIEGAEKLYNYQGAILVVEENTVRLVKKENA